MALEIQELTKTYGDFSVRLDCSVADGETLALVGPSGCGKTTALSLITGLVQAERGVLRSDGEDISRLPPWKRNISVVFQDLALFPHLDAGQNIAYGLFIRGVPKRERRRVVAETLRIVRLSGYEKRRINTLSGGERQRIAIARALATAPRALLLDEPFSSLDAPLRREIRQEFLDIRAQSKAPCIFVTHDREEAAILGDRIALMSAGRIIERGSARELFLAPKTEAGAWFFGAGQVLPCTIEAHIPEGTQVNSPLGRLIIPPGSEYSVEAPFLFIPRDALVLTGDRTTQSGRPPVTGLFRKSMFAGERLILQVALPQRNTGSGETVITVEARLRTGLPPLGSPLEITIDQSLLRFVKPRIKISD
ncbi:MAG: ABC transporter ATP-binding protein [Treponema sp.]|jgi:ABC-type Fe3+/spermidine/putrescine transport system ATPase subunit|nr:ABC transporter ATP-binding protein [Treponema sp.]